MYTSISLIRPSLTISMTNIFSKCNKSEIYLDPGVVKQFDYDKLNLTIDCTNHVYENKIGVYYSQFDSIILKMTKIDDKKSKY